MSENPTADQVWHALLDGQFDWTEQRKRFRIFSAKHRCKNCHAPFEGIGAYYARWRGRGQYNRNPRFCNF
jgi:hypothetical protein